MLSATITGKILNYYEAAFSALPILVGFIPMLMGTGGNCGSQSSTMIIRGMAIDQIRLKDFFKVIWLELRVSLIISVTLAVVNGARIILMYWSNPQKMSLALVISISIVGIVIISQFIGCSLPMLAKKLKLDPAVMAAPLITTIVDAASIFIYFTVATKFFNI
jgi:magnesium transporter